MDVTQIRASVRYSADLSEWGGGWKTVELGAEATPAPDSGWEEQQAELYDALSAQLRCLFVRVRKEGRGKGLVDTADKQIAYGAEPAEALVVLEHPVAA